MLYKAHIDDGNGCTIIQQPKQFTAESHNTKRTETTNKCKNTHFSLSFSVVLSLSVFDVSRDLIQIPAQVIFMSLVAFDASHAWLVFVLVGLVECAFELKILCDPSVLYSVGVCSAY